MIIVPSCICVSRMLQWSWYSYCCGSVHSDWVSSSNSSHHRCDGNLLEKKSKVQAISMMLILQMRNNVEVTMHDVIYCIIESRHMSNTRVLVMLPLCKVEKCILGRLCMKIQTEQLPPPPQESSSWLSVLPMWPLLPALHSQPLKLSDNYYELWLA